MIKRLIAILCAFTCLTANMVSAAPLFDDISEGTTEEKILNIVTGVGLMQGNGDGTFAPREDVTRAEVAQIIYNAITKNFKDNSSNDVDAPEIEWKDIDDSHWAYNVVNYVADLGIMVGDGDGIFRPEDTVTYREIIKTVLNLSGYEYEADFYGGWPTGYERIASNNGLNKGVSGLADSRMSRMDVAKILYNLFALPVRELKWNGHVTTIEAKEETFMNDKMNVHAITGTLTKTDLTSVDGSQAADLYFAEIDGFEFTFDGDFEVIRDEIGKNLRIFVYENEEDEVFELLCYEETGRDEIVEIDARYLKDFSDNIFSYYEDDSYSKRKTLEIDNGFHLIYNGKYTDTHSDETLNFDKGTIKVISNTALGYDVVVAEDFGSGYITSINKSANSVINDIATGTQTKNIVFASDEEDIIYSIYDNEGSPIKFNDLGKGVISYYENDNYIKAHYSTKTVTGVVKSEYSEDGENYLKIDDVTYIIEEDFYNVEGRPMIENGMTVTAYLDKWGEIVWITADIAVLNTGYLVSVVQEDDGEKILFKYYDLSQKAGAITESAEILTYSDAYGIENKLTSYEAIRVALEDYVGIFSYEKNKDGQIKRVEIPIEMGQNSSSQSRIRTMLKTNDDVNSEYYKENYGYYSNLNMFMNSSVYTNGGTLLLRVPEDNRDFANYTLTSGTMTGISSSTLDIYNYDQNSIIAKLVVAQKPSTTFSLSELIFPVIVTNVEVVYSDEQDEAVTQLTVTDGSSTSVLVPDTDYVDFNAVPSPFGSYGKDRRATYAIEPGDLIRYTAQNGKVVACNLLFDADAKNPAWYGGSHANQDITVPEGNENYTDVLGAFPGSTGYCDDDVVYTNPIIYVAEKPSAIHTLGEYTSHQSFVYGYIHSNNEGLYTITTQNLKEGFDGFDDENYFRVAHPLQGANIVLVSKTRTGVSIKKGSISDLKTYEEVGVDCSRVLACFYTHWSVRTVYVFLDE